MTVRSGGRRFALVAAMALPFVAGGCAMEIGGFVNDRSATARVATSEALVLSLIHI